MLTGADVQQLKDYVAANDAGGQKQAESTVRLHVTHSNLKAKFIEIRLDLHVRHSLASVLLTDKKQAVQDCSVPTVFTPCQVQTESSADRGLICRCLSVQSR